MARVMRTYRVPEDVYEAAKAKAEERGETLTEVIVAALKRYAKKR